MCEDRPMKRIDRTSAAKSLVVGLAALALCVAGNPAPAGEPQPFEKWEPWQATRFRVDYPVVLRTNPGDLQLWFSARNDGLDRMIVLSGPHLGDLPDRRARILFGTDLVGGYDRPLNGLAHPIMTRASAAVLRDGTHVVLAAIGPAYAGGSELYPALFVSRNGVPGTWRHLGPPAGEPAEWLVKARRLNGQFRIEGGSILELQSGRLRMYIHGFCDPRRLDALLAALPEGGPVSPARLYAGTVFIAESDAIEGPWRFLRDADGACVDIVNGLAPGCNWLFPNVMRIGEHGYMLTGGDQWPPTGSWAAFSADGIRFRCLALPGGPVPPVLRPSDILPGATAMKVLRGAFNPETGHFDAVATVGSADGRWQLYHSRAHFNTNVFEPAEEGVSTQRNPNP